MAQRKPNMLDWLMLAVMVSIWGSSLALVKVAVEGMAPLWVTALRMAIAALVLVPAVWLQGRTLPRRLDVWAWFAGLAVIGNVLPFYLIAWGTQKIPSGLAGILMASTPIMAIVGAHLALPDERLNLRTFTGFLVGFVGVGVLIGPELLWSEGPQIDVWGELSLVAASLCFASHNIIARKMPRVDPTETAAGVMTVAGIIGLFLALVQDPTSLAQVPLQAYVPVLVLGVVATGFAVLLLYSLIGRNGISFTSYSSYLIPCCAVLVGWLVMGEPLSTEAVIGLCLILSGIAISRYRNH
ncbi:drug/metabolite transporter (DMT)-like permease [Rhodoligotrophos appendicifer]|uniref:DMT family transporter n=1 Tax=Rhodoligotrophos appendicifer TaxID=987056 RepID=UPI00117FAE8C|nr:DMT family transporter [Rhodoligotrophos appendicifer]